MQSEQITATIGGADAVNVPGQKSAARALATTPAFWLAMFGASALGTNLGDFWSDSLSLGLAASFATLVVIAGLLIWGDRAMAARTEAFFWLGIVMLRAAATNVGDFITHDLGVSYGLAAAGVGIVTIIAGRFTAPASTGGASPGIDARYWGVMFIAGVFGTIGGDFVSHNLGLFAAMVLLGAILVVVIAARAKIAPTLMVGYWCVVLAERAAGTPAGDWLASERGAGLGLPLAMVCSGALLVAGLWLRRRMENPFSGS